MSTHKATTCFMEKYEKLSLNYLSHVMRKPVFVIYETKGQISLRIRAV